MDACFRSPADPLSVKLASGFDLDNCYHSCIDEGLEIGMQVISKLLLLIAATASALPTMAAGQNTKFPTAPATPVRELIVAMDVTIAPDGAVASVVPDATLPEPMRQLLVKRVSQWRYEVPMWQGKPAKLSSRLALRLLAVPTTTGGFVMRVVSTAGEDGTGTPFGRVAPIYPHSAVRRGVGGTFVYSQRVHADGHVTDIKRLYPEDVSNKMIKAMDESSQLSLRASRWRPVVVNDEPVACDLITPINFRSAGTDVAGKLPVDTKAMRGALAQPCPSTWLKTKIENTIL